MVWVQEGIAFLVFFVYCSYFEWFVHRHLMHVKRPFPFYEAFKGHTLIHHQLYHWNGTYEYHGPGRPKHIALRWYAFPTMIGCHIPVFWAIQTFTPWHHMLWGAVAACVAYFSGYEYTHYLMHVPKGHRVEKYRWFQFIKEHHRLHHKYMLRNLNVLIPLADLTFGTLVTSEGWRSKTAKRARNLEAKQQNEPPKVPASMER